MHLEKTGNLIESKGVSVNKALKNCVFLGLQGSEFRLLRFPSSKSAQGHWFRPSPAVQSIDIVMSATLITGTGSVQNRGLY